jgi:uncharacterized protein (DUF952 family)
VLVFKILLPDEWAGFESSGRFDGSAFDRQSGFIHCSSRQQVGSTAQRFFADEPDLVVLTVDPQLLGDTLRWEPASNGELFPHVYGALPRAAVVSVHHVAGATQVEKTLGGAPDP